MSEADDRIQAYWSSRAAAHGGDPTATTRDVHLRELEIAALLKIVAELPLATRQVLDVGCGDGWSTLRIARGRPKLRVTGIDFSQPMIDAAREALAAAPELQRRVRFGVGDVRTLELGEPFGLVLTDRCLINLPTLAEQTQALRQIAAHLEPGGYYVGIEGFAEGQRRMNALRGAIGLPEIPVRWHNRFFEPEELACALAPHFEAPVMHDFSSAYYVATRVIYARMCQMRGQAPDYDHDIHRLAVELPWFGDFGPLRLFVTRRTRSKPRTHHD